MESESTVATKSVTAVCREGPLSETVIYAVAEARGVDPLDLDPLYRVVDPSLLDDASGSLGSFPAAYEVRFEWEGCQVTVLADGEVHVTPRREADDPPNACPVCDR